MVRLPDRPNMTLDVYRGRKTTTQQQQQFYLLCTCRVMPLFQTIIGKCVPRILVIPSMLIFGILLGADV